MIRRKPDPVECLNSGVLKEGRSFRNSDNTCAFFYDPASVADYLTVHRREDPLRTTKGSSSQSIQLCPPQNQIISKEPPQPRQNKHLVPLLDLLRPDTLPVTHLSTESASDSWAKVIQALQRTADLPYFKAETLPTALIRILAPVSAERNIS
ncbi:hypothetical protein ONS96_013869 [Cadophora gregata f. sp. sojae]|nr:hypothetical protein ONS96_013869 [Cadophora gregata f. sp. sojae]